MTIDAVKPGDTVAYQGDTVVVSAAVYGLKANEPVHLVYSSADGRSAEQAVPMVLPPHDHRYQAELPPGRRASSRTWNIGCRPAIARRGGSASRRRPR